MDFVDQFPPELVEKIFNFLSIADLVSVSRVSVSWYIASNSSRLWREAIKKSSSRDRFIKLSDLDKFNGISSNYDSDHSFNVEKPSTSCLPPMNPWKLSLCRHNFVHRNLRGERPYAELARHEIAFENCMEIHNLNVIFPSKSAQDCLYLPVVGRKRGETVENFYLIRLDGVPKVIHLFTIEAFINHFYIDRHGIFWMENSSKANYVPIVDNFNSFQSIKSGGSLFESLVHNLLITEPYSFCDLLMDADHLAVYSKGKASQKQVKIWCRKTFKLEMTITPDDIVDISSFYFNNGHFYLVLSQYDSLIENKVEIYNVKQDKLISVLDVESQILCIVFGVKYYAFVSVEEFGTYFMICVCDIKTNKVMFNITASGESNTSVWFVEDSFLYMDYQESFDRLKVLNLFDWTVSDGLSLEEYVEMYFKLDVMGSCLFVIDEEEGRVDVWDWKLGLKLQEILMPQMTTLNLHVNENRLVRVGETSVQVVGFW